MVIKQATEQDFAYAFSFIEKLWDYNVYDKEIVKSVYKEVLADDKSFAFFLCDENGNYCGFCHGSFFPTFWMSGSTCYLASIITDEKYRGMGVGHLFFEKVKEIKGQKKFDGIELQVNAKNRAAYEMYSKYGFTEKSINIELN